MFISKAFADALVLGSTRSLADTMLIQCDAVIARLIFSPKYSRKTPCSSLVRARATCPYGLFDDLKVEKIACWLFLHNFVSMSTVITGFSDGNEDLEVIASNCLLVKLVHLIWGSDTWRYYVQISCDFQELHKLSIQMSQHWPAAGVAWPFDI